MDSSAMKEPPAGFPNPDPHRAANVYAATLETTTDIVFPYNRPHTTGLKTQRVTFIVSYIHL